MRSKRTRQKQDEIAPGGVVVDSETSEVEREPESAAEPVRAAEPAQVEVEADDNQLASDAKSDAPPPPAAGASPEDILGLQVQILDPADIDSAKAGLTDPGPSDRGTPRSEPESSLSTTGGSPPMEDYEERAAMAKEVLRAGSDQARSGRRKTSKTEDTALPSEEALSEDPDADDSELRVSDDLTITASKRDRRKLFGR